MGTSKLCSAGDGRGKDKDPVLEGRVLRWRSSNAKKNRAQLRDKETKHTGQFYMIYDN